MATEWSRLRKEEPAKITSPRRVVFSAGGAHGDGHPSQVGASEKQTVLDMKWLPEMDGWTYMQWNSQKGQLELMEDQPPFPHETLLESLTELRKLGHSDSIKKFASLKGIPQQPQAEWINFQLELGFRPQGDRMWELLLPLINNSCLHPLGARLRRDRPGLSGLASQIQQAVGGW